MRPSRSICVALLLLGALCRHHGANPGPEPQEQRQGSQALQVQPRVRTPEIAIENDVGRHVLPAAVEIHQQEGEVVEGVDGREILIELDGIEQHRAVAPEHDIVEMQVAVAAANESRPMRVHRAERRSVAFRLSRGRESRGLREPADFTARVDECRDRILASRPADPGAPVLMPGDVEARHAAAQPPGRLRVSARLWADLRHRGKGGS